MAPQGRKSCTNQPSIKYRRVPLEFASFELADVGKEEDACTRSDFRPECSKQSAPKSSKNMLSTSEFISAVGGIWNSLNQPYAIFQSKPNVKENDVCETENVVCFSDDAIIKASNCYIEYFHAGSKSSRFFPYKVNSNLEHLKAIQRMSVLEPCSRHASNISSLWRYTRAANSDAHMELRRTDGLESVGFCYDVGRIYGCIFENPFNGLKDLVKFTRIDCTKPAETIASENKTPPTDITLSGNMDCKSNDLPNLTKCKDCVGGENAEPIENMRQPVSSLSTSYSPGPVANVEAYAISRPPCSGLYSDYHIKCLASSYSTVVESSEESSVSEDKDTCGDGERQFKGLVLEDDPPTELSLSMQNKPANVVAKQRHAIAGALAGTFVSLCLHPVDTVKTVIQARSMDQNSIGRVFGSIVSERGITGLYRGIASNIASSAPISAVYTFTYESIKGAMLPLLPKEYHSFAHCTAGGCASIATSFIFTPSERIKQQMQVGSHYQNCWTALVGILERGGLASLYAGWGAVLCRNIPHSIIKFYTYESLKQWMLSSQQSNAPNTLQTLVCGGVAASTAALFTTPFDVVKTRLQTQIPGSLKHYDGVLHALQEIAKREGLKGLYRGLTPRLAMYMSQGAIFFASYEFFKRVFSFELPKLPARIIEDRQNVEDHSALSRLHGFRS